MTLQVEGLTFTVGAKALVSDLSFSVDQGEVFAVLGQNGAGKSSLFKMISGEWKPAAGTLQFNGRALSQWPRGELARYRAVLPQHSSLSFDFSVEEVVMLGRSPHATGTVQDRAISEQAMAHCDILHLRERIYTSLSGGEKQRVQLARVLCQIWQEAPQQDRLLLLDEPTSALDLAHQHSLLKLARTLASQRVAVLVVLHDLNLAAAYADRMLLLHQGKQVALGSPEAVLQPSLVECVFGMAVDVIAHPQTGKPLVVC